jgi:hypothetical protein
MQTLLLHSKERMLSAISRKTVQKTNGVWWASRIEKVGKDTVLRRLFMTSISIIGRRNHALKPKRNS